MIIVSQDKTSIIKFDNIEEIYVSGKFINVNYSLNNNECIAEYKTEERAKEVLQKIGARYQAQKIYECADALNQNKMVNKYLETGILPFSYEMPEE